MTETVAGHVETDAMRARAAPLGVNHGLPMDACFTTSAALFDPAPGKAAAPGR
jgi:hypothetical protein